VALSTNGQNLALGNADGTVHLWDLRQLSTAPKILSDHVGDIRSVVFSPDGQRMVSGGLDKTVGLWDLQQISSAPIVIHGSEAVIYSVTFSPDSQTLALGDADGIVWLWDLRRLGADPTVLHGHEAAATSVEFSPDGQTLASGSLDGTVRLWDLRKPSVDPTIFRGYEEPVWSVAFSSNGKTLASGSNDGIVRLWDLHELNTTPITLRGHEDRVLSVMFSPDGERLASGSADQTVRIWVVRAEILADKICEKVWRNLTLDEWHQFVGKDIPYERTCTSLLSGEGSRSAPQFTIEQFLVSKGEVPATVAKTSTEITAAVKEVIHIAVDVSTIAEEQQEELLFAWYTCSKGGIPVLWRIGNPEMYYVAPKEPVLDCIRVVIEKEGTRLAELEIFVDVQK
jgi:hypothetical protein